MSKRSTFVNGVSLIIYCPTSKLKPGMILAADLNLSTVMQSSAYVLTKGQVLSELFIERMAKLQIEGVYVVDDKKSNASAENALKTRALCDIEQAFNDFKTKNFVLDDVYVDRLSSLSDDLVRNIQMKNAYATNLLDLKNYDDYTFQHSLSVAVLCITTGIKLGLSRTMLNELALSALLHDIGKMMIPIEIINKAGTLTKEEFEIVKQHPMNAVQHLKKNEQISATIIGAVEHHHEKFNGSGYPHGIKGEEIPQFGRILAICDVYDALTSNRPYRKSWFRGDAVEFMMSGSDSHFDQEILTAFLKSAAVYPVGARVLLSNGKKAIVTKNYSECTLRPIVRILNPDGSSGEFVNLIDLNFTNITIIGIEYAEAV